MWIYQQQEVLPCPETSCLQQAPATEEKNCEVALPAAVDCAESALTQAENNNLPTLRREVLLLAAAYLLGCFAAGYFLADCTAQEQDVLTRYLQQWQNLFSVQNAAQAAALLRTLILCVCGALSSLLLLGLSALGTLPICLFMMLYGTGTGLLNAQLLSALPLRQQLVIAAVSGIPLAIATGVLCRFGASAMRVSHRLFVRSFFSGGREPHTPWNPIGAQRLLWQYACSSLIFLPLCGAAVCLAHMAAWVL